MGYAHAGGVCLRKSQGWTRLTHMNDRKLSISFRSWPSWPSALSSHDPPLSMLLPQPILLFFSSSFLFPSLPPCCLFSFLPPFLSYRLLFFLPPSLSPYLNRISLSLLPSLSPPSTLLLYPPPSLPHLPPPSLLFSLPSSFLPSFAVFFQLPCGLQLSSGVNEWVCGRLRYINR